jgi:spore germination protein KC
VALLLSGCSFPERYPIEDMQNILMAGVDVVDGKIVLTAVVDKITKGNKPGEEKIGTQVYTATGETVFDAKCEMHSFSQKRISWFNLKYILIGEEAARLNLGEVLDYFTEDDETRLTHRLLVSKGMSAADFVRVVVTQEGIFSDNLDSLVKESDRTGKSSEVDLLSYAVIGDSDWKELYIPTVQLKAATPHGQIMQGQQQGSEAEYLVQLEGYALFHNGNLAGYMDGDEAKGLNIVLNKLKSTVFTVADYNGALVSLEVLKSEASIETKTGDKPSAEIKVNMSTCLVDYHETHDVMMEQYIKNLEQQLNAAIMTSIGHAVLAAQQDHTDVLGIGDAFYHEHPVEWEKLKGRWQDIFPSVEISIRVTSNIVFTFEMTDATGK